MATRKHYKAEQEDMKKKLKMFTCCQAESGNSCPGTLSPTGKAV
ncbi:Uncharacterized protein dnm_033080 [Desulfonema magnum]|uniref:Uncharacterized protein n=1 Tax=Desulfonema magnum TaxID=45655 RepID=A0A975BKV4_9BACT|nr:Uncharacterized protein dnm_033080 [Desulfonema magnum]